MQAPQIPDNEQERLEALSSSQLNNTGQKEQFQVVTELASKIFGVPIAYISSISSDKQYIHASCGLDFKSSDRSTSFCGHTILQDDIFYIPDTMKDERFKDNPLVVDKPNIRFYAGYPLNSEEGCKIGSLCIADNKPRELSNTECEILVDLGSIIEERLKLLKMTYGNKEEA